MNPYRHQLNNDEKYNSIPGRIIPGFLADKAGRYNVTIVVAIVTSILCLALWIPSDGEGAIIAFAVLYGLFSGSFISLAPSLIAQISDVAEIGIRQGTCFALQSFGALTGSPIAGAITAAQNGSYLGLQLFCGLCLLASMVAYLLARTTLVGVKFTRA